MYYVIYIFVVAQGWGCLYLEVVDVCLKKVAVGRLLSPYKLYWEGNIARLSITILPLKGSSIEALLFFTRHTT